MKSEWLGFSTTTSDDVALRVAATKLNVDVEELELERDGGCVKVRKRDKSRETRSQMSSTAALFARNLLDELVGGDRRLAKTAVEDYFTLMRIAAEHGDDIELKNELNGMVGDKAAQLSYLLEAMQTRKSESENWEGSYDDDTMATTSSDSGTSSMCDSATCIDPTQSQP